MKVVINGQAQLVTSATLAELCQQYADGSDFIATAVNGDFIALNERQALRLKEGDKIEILSPRQGG